MSKRNGAIAGAHANTQGKYFEEKTNNMQRLIDYTKHKFTKKSKKINYISKTFDDKTIILLLQNNFKIYMKYKYEIDIFRCPDEAYIIEYNTGRTVIKILEKKAQNGPGSVETKLWAGPALKREYEIAIGSNFEVIYGFCVNNYLKDKIISSEKKYIILNEILNENNIEVLFGDDTNYFKNLDVWINNSL